LFRQRLLSSEATPAVEAFKSHGEDFIVANGLEELVDENESEG
jgi:predicted oxidoreductase